MSTYTETMERSRLVQRVKPPYGKPNPFAFGGGYKNGGLSDEASDLIHEIWSFDYMGAAEFEFGAVPKALNKMVECTTGKIKKRSGLTTFTIDGYSKPIFVLCRPEQAEEIERRIRAWAEEEYGYYSTSEFATKEAVLLNRVLNEAPDEQYPREVVGWLELNNGYFFSIDPEMFANTCKLFGVEVSDG